MCNSSVLVATRNEPSVPVQSPLAVHQIPSSVVAKVDDANGSFFANVLSHTAMPDNPES